jgi:magnesium transporter
MPGHERRANMIKYYFSDNESLKESDTPVTGCWINMIQPNASELEYISQKYMIDPDALRAALDVDERSRIETDDNYTMVLVNIPTIETDSENELYTTIPLSVLLTSSSVITVCSEATPVLETFVRGKIKDFHTNMKSRFILQILFRTATLYLQYLHIIDKKSDEVEHKLHRSTQNRELIELLKLEKSLVYFSSALRSNEMVMEKLFRNESIKKYPEDSDLLEDVIVENKQAIEMANIYSGILSGMMDAFASVISNNLNIVMKILAIVTIVMAIPTMIFSAYGMNVNTAWMPFSQTPHGFIIIVGMAAVISVMATLIFTKFKMFK